MVEHFKSYIVKTTCLLLAFVILVGYTGISVFTMVCSKSNSHISTTFFHKKACIHQKKSCCTAQSEKPCCSFLFSFHQLKDYSILNKASHYTKAFNAPVALFSKSTRFHNIATNYLSIVALANYSPPNLPVESSNLLAKIGVFRI